MIKLQIKYWHSRPQESHLIEEEMFEYADTKAYNRALKKFMKRIDQDGYNSMVLSNMNGEPRETVILFVDKGRFRQC